MIFVDPFQCRIFYDSMKSKMQKSLRSICNVEREKRKAMVPISLNEWRAMHRQDSVYCSLPETRMVSEINDDRYWKRQVEHN